MDEYILPIEKDNLKDFLKDFENKCSAIALNWILFDSNGYDKHPEGKLITEAYVRTYKDYRKTYSRYYIKSIIDPKKTYITYDAHHHITKGKMVNSDMEEVEVTSYTEKLHDDKIVVNHYCTKSKEDYLIKISRGDATYINPKSFDEKALNFPETSYNYTILKYKDKLREKVFS